MARGTAKSPEAFRTISEAADALELPQHVLRFWETRFSQIKPMKRSGGRRYYRPNDIALLRGIRHLLYDEGYTIKGVQRILRERGIGHVAGLVAQADVAFDADVGDPVEPVLPDHVHAPATTPLAIAPVLEPDHPQAPPPDPVAAKPAHNGFAPDPAPSPTTETRPSQPAKSATSGLRFVPEPVEEPLPPLDAAPIAQQPVPAPVAPVQPAATYAPPPPVAIAPPPQPATYAPPPPVTPVPALTAQQSAALTDALRVLEACKSHLDQTRASLASAQSWVPEPGKPPEPGSG